MAGWSCDTDFDDEVATFRGAGARLTRRNVRVDVDIALGRNASRRDKKSRKRAENEPGETNESSGRGGEGGGVRLLQIAGACQPDVAKVTCELTCRRRRAVNWR